MSQSGYVHIEVDILKETDSAFLILYEGEKIWIPKSQIANADDYNVGDENITLSITEWIANQKGIETDE